MSLRPPSSYNSSETPTATSLKERIRTGSFWLSVLSTISQAILESLVWLKT